MKKLILRPVAFACAITECPPGLFLSGEMVGLKTEYGQAEAFCDSGEAYCGTGNVIPLEAVWEEEE